MPPSRLFLSLALLVACAAVGSAAEPAYPTLAYLSERAARRFPQPVRVGNLIGRTVLAPKEQQPVLGRVDGLVRPSQGSASVVIDLSGWLGLTSRRVAVPIDAIALLGEYVALLDLTPEQLRASPTFDPGSVAEIPPDETIAVGLVKPFH